LGFFLSLWFYKLFGSFVPTISIDFTFAVKGCHFGVEEDIEFFFDAGLTFSIHWGEWFCPLN
jgi:hypothetical protein